MPVKICLLPPVFALKVINVNSNKMEVIFCQRDGEPPVITSVSSMRVLSAQEACSKEGSAVNKQESTFKPAGGAPGPNPSPFSLGQVWESRGSKEQEGLGIEEHEPQDMDGAGNTEQWDRKKNWSQEHRSVRFQEEAGRIAQPEAPLMLEERYL
eukprot:1159534-Pelagomonas_calceolata.AAC.9